MCNSVGVVHVPIDAAVYSFEGILPDLDSPPIAARRAINHTGLRLAIEGWRSLSIDERQKVTVAGLPERVDVEGVALSLRRASPGPQRVSPAPNPDPFAPPEALVRALEPARTLDARRWSRLRAIDRYALMHTYRRAVARSAFSMLAEAYDIILLASTRPPSPSTAPPPPVGYRAPGFYSAVTPTDTGAGRVASSRSAPPPPVAPVPPLSAPPSGVPGPGILPSGLPPAFAPGLSSLRPGGDVHLADVAAKPKSVRHAIATGFIRMQPATFAQVIGRETPKGEAFTTARVAAIMAVKRTHELLPLARPVALTRVDVRSR